jgi:SRSO17 transposase
MPGVSCHFDHISGRQVMGQQILTLVLAGKEGFVPLDSELFISQSKAQSLQQPFHDGRNTVAKRYRIAQHQTKPEIAASMIHRSLRGEIIEADYLLADAWFGSKAMIRLSQDTHWLSFLE